MENILSALDSEIQYLSHEFMTDQVVFRRETHFVTTIWGPISKKKIAFEYKKNQFLVR